MIVPASHVQLVARTVYGEARGESFNGKLAVAWVIRNRVDDPGPDWWGDDYARVVLKKSQYSAWFDINLFTMLTVDESDPIYRHCLAAALLAIENLADDPTHGATHYHAIEITPTWAAGRTPTATIGRHRFYKLGSGA